MKKSVFTSRAPKPIGPYSQAVKAGKFLFVSGQLPIKPEEGKIVVVDISSQTRQVLENVKAILEEADCNMRNVVSVTVYLSSMALFDEFNAAYAKFFEKDFPARTTITCELRSGAFIELSVVAYKD